MKSLLLVSMCVSASITVVFAIEVQIVEQKDDKVTLKFINDTNDSIFLSDPEKYGITLLFEGGGGISLGKRIGERENKHLIFLAPKNDEVSDAFWSCSIEFQSDEIRGKDLKRCKVQIRMNEFGQVKNLRTVKLRLCEVSIVGQKLGSSQGNQPPVERK